MNSDFEKEIKEQMGSISKVLFKTSFDLIFELIDSCEILINVPKYEIVNHKAVLSKNDSGGFTVNIENIFSDMSETYDIELLIGDNIYLVPNLLITMKGTKLKRDEHNNYFSGQIVFSGQIHELKCKTDNESELYNRFIIPSENRQLDFYVKTESYCDESTIHTAGKLSIEIDNYNFAMYEKKYRDKYYFIIDSIEHIESNKFSDICHSIMIGFGFLSADFIQGEAFYFASEDNDFNSIDNFSYVQLRPSIFSNGTCNPIYSNPYGYTKDETIVSEVRNIINVFDSSIFSKLCNKIYEQEDYATLILLMLEANTSSLILRPAGYSVALEKITNIIVEENKGLKPIPDKKISKKLKTKFKDILISLSEDIKNVGSENSLIILQKKIESINSPTNRDKLIKPFETYDIELNEGDLNAINNRNNFLHGRNIKINKNTNEFTEVYQVSLRLNKLINKLILKHIGFSGIIVNHLKHNESSFDFEINESLFERI